MNRINVTILMCVLSIAVYAQEKAEIEVSYNIHSLYANGVKKTSKYHLLANSTLSKYFNTHSEELDSLTSTPEGLANFQKTQHAALKAMVDKGEIISEKLPGKKENVYVIKSTQDSTITVYDMLKRDHVYYTEPFSEMVWEIGDSTKNILGYECFHATTDYHGRVWDVWFTPEIPIQDGPWKFRGLPGLILEATTGDDIGFFADGIEQTTKKIKNVYGSEKYEKQDRKEILRARRAMIDNPIGTLAASGFVDVVKSVSNGLNNKSESFDFIETDYRK